MSCLNPENTRRVNHGTNNKTNYRNCLFSLPGTAGGGADQLPGVDGEGDFEAELGMEGVMSEKGKGKSENDHDRGYNGIESDYMCQQCEDLIHEHEWKMFNGFCEECYMEVSE